MYAVACVRCDQVCSCSRHNREISFVDEQVVAVSKLNEFSDRILWCATQLSPASLESSESRRKMYKMKKEDEIDWMRTNYEVEVALPQDADR